MSFKNSYLENLMEKVVRRNPGETEFHQAVREVLESLDPHASGLSEILEKDKEARSLAQALLQKYKKG